MLGQGVRARAARPPSHSAHLGQRQVLQAGEARQVGHATVRQPAAAALEAAQGGEAGEGGAAGVGDAGAEQIQALQAGEAGDVGQAGVCSGGQG